MLDIVLFIFGIMAAGFLARQFGLLPADSYKPLNDYIYYVSMPALIFAKLALVHLGLEHLPLLAANLIPITAMMVISVGIWKLRLCSRKLSAALLLTSFFGNIVYMGFPIVEMKFGADALSSAAIIAFVYNLMIFTIGMALLSRMSGSSDKEFARKKLLGNTVVISCIAGFLVSVSGIALPSILTQIIGAVGATTAPLALFSIGFFLHGKKIAKAPSRVALLCAVKLLFFPSLFIATAALLGFGGQPFRISLLEALMPIAVTNFVIAQKFGLDSELVAESVLASTLLSIPVLLGFDYLSVLFA